MSSELVPALVSVLAALAPAQASSLVERARAALGSAPKDAQLEGRGRAHASGVDGELAVAFAADGAFRIDFDSPLDDCMVSDGTTVWNTDRMGLVRDLALEDADTAKLLAWVLSGHWTAARELEVTPLPFEVGTTPRLELALRGTPMRMTLAVDPTTALPSELGYVDASGAVRWTFEDWRDVAGTKLPHRWAFDDGANVDRYSIDAYRAVPRDASRFRAAEVAPGDVRFDPEAPAELDVDRVLSGHLLVEPAVEGDSVGMFIFDTGAGAMTIDSSVADELGLESVGEVMAVGIGGKTSTAFRRGKRFELGPLVLDDPVYLELDLSFLDPIFGCKVAGIVGFDLLARCVAEIEPKAAFIALHDPARYTLAGASWQPLLLNGNTPCVRATFEGEREGLFRLDTGANGTVSFHAPAVRELALLEGRTVSNGFAGGVGGTSETRDGALEWFELAGHRFTKPLVSFSLADHGALSDRYTLGNIGQTFLEPFRIVLDYPHDRIAFVPVKGGR